jgi:hypothetical protein
MNANGNIAAKTTITDLDAFRHLATKADWVDPDVDTNDEFGWTDIEIWNRKHAYMMKVTFNADGTFSTGRMYWQQGEDRILIAQYIDWAMVPQWLYDYAA